MKKVILIFLSFALLTPVFAQTRAENKTDAQGRKQGYWEKVDPKTGKIVYKGTFKDNKPQGLFTYYYPETDSVHSKTDFRQDGKIAYVQLFHLVSGKIQAKGKYVNEEKDSTWNFYDERGNIISTEGYKAGKKDGPSKIFFPEGKVSEEKVYKNGKLNGPFKMYYDEKLVKAEGAYVNDNYDGLCAWYYPNGILASKGLYDKGTKKGFWIFKEKDGKVKSKEVWVDGKQLGPKEMEEYLKKNPPNGRAGKTATEEKKETKDTKKPQTAKGAKK